MRVILNRLFLAVRLGGCGFINSEETRKAAYTASLLFCAPKMRDFCPTIGELALVACSTRELQNMVSSLRARGVQCLDAVNSTLLWTLRPKIWPTKTYHCRVTSHTPPSRAGFPPHWSTTQWCCCTSSSISERDSQTSPTWHFAIVVNGLMQILPSSSTRWTMQHSKRRYT